MNYRQFRTKRSTPQAIQLPNSPQGIWSLEKMPVRGNLHATCCSYRELLLLPPPPPPPLLLLLLLLLPPPPPPPTWNRIDTSAAYQTKIRKVHQNSFATCHLLGLATAAELAATVQLPQLALLVL
jgi:hypothetical protein